MNDQILEEMAEGRLKVEMHGSLPGSEKQLLLGQGLLPMAGLLQYGVQVGEVRRIAVVMDYNILNPFYLI